MINPKYLHAQFHGHSYYSDGLNSPFELAQTAIAKKIQYLALTDHDSIDGIDEFYNATHKLNQLNKTNLIPIAGMEYKTPDGEIILLKPAPQNQLKPFLAFCREIVKNPISSNETVNQAIINHDCLIIFPHPIFFLGLSANKIKEIISPLPPKIKQNIGIEIHNGAMQIIPGISFRDVNIKKIASNIELQYTSNADYHAKSQINSLITQVPFTDNPSYNHLISNFQSRHLIHQEPYNLGFIKWTRLLHTQLKALGKNFISKNLFNKQNSKI